MNVFDDYSRKLLAELNRAGVQYLVVGGYAVNFHGYRRTTGDIDFMTFISGVKFSEAWEKKVNTVLDRIEIPFIHLNHLIISKISNGRSQDKTDVEMLQKIQSLKKKK